MRKAAFLLFLLCLFPQLVFTQTSTGTPTDQASGQTGTSGTSPASTTAAAGTGAAGTAAAGAAPAAGTTPAPSPGTPDLKVPADNAKQWTVGFTVFGAEDLSK